MAASIKNVATGAHLRWVARDGRGAAIVEYLLLLFLIAIVCMIAIGVFGMANHDKITNVANSVGA